MNLRQIEVFRAVMRAGSMSAAARMLHVSQPGISRMLSHIELQLGVQLFERGGGRLRPTPEAQALHAQVEHVYRGVQRIDAAARALQSGGGVSLRVLASPAAALELVPQAVASVARAYPGARFYLETQLVREMVALMARREADVAISTLALDEPQLRSEVIGEWSLACVFPVGHPFGAMRSVSLAQVLEQPLIAFSPDTPQGQVITEGSQRLGREPASRIEVRSGQAACALAACGAGVAIVDSLTARAMRRDDLGFRPLRGGPRFKVHAVHAADLPLSTPAQRFIEEMRAGLRALEARRSRTA